MIGDSTRPGVQRAFPSASSPMRPLRVRRRPVSNCPCGCGTVGFCDAHRARLHRVREELRVSSGRVKSIANKRKMRQGPPRCCNPACSETRVPPAAFCDQCIDDGWTEEAA